MRGFLAGAVTGAFVSAVGLGTASLMGPQPAGPDAPATPQMDGPVAAVQGGEGASATPSAPVTPPAPDQATPDVTTTVTQDIVTPQASSDSAAAVDTTPAQVDATTDTSAPGPVTGGEEQVALPDGGAPVLPTPQVMAPAAPAGETDIAISTSPEQPALPQGDDTILVVDEDALAPVPQEDRPPVRRGDSTPEMPKDPNTTAAPVTPDAPSDGAAGNAEGGELPGAADSETANATPETAEPETDTQAKDTVPVNRPGASSGEPADAGGAAPNKRDALAAYGMPFTGDTTLNGMAVLLRDDPAMEHGPAMIAELPMPVTVLIDPTQPEAKARMSAYRAAGIEVAAIASVPSGATAQDAAQVLEATFMNLPETVAYVDLTGSTAPDGIARSVIDNLAADRRGLVVPEQGLNAAKRLADRDDLPALTIYRDLDGAGQDARAVRRFLDQAAFRARQEDNVVVTGRVRAETLSALTLWSSASRAETVALSPLSRLLTRVAAQ